MGILDSKYIVLEELYCNGFTHDNVIIVFPASLEHAFVAKCFGTKPISAGFVSSDGNCYGHSQGLDLESREIDSKIYKAFIQKEDHRLWLYHEYSKKLGEINSVINKAKYWCDNQSNGMTDGEVCISFLKTIRRILQEDNYQEGQNMVGRSIA